MRWQQMAYGLVVYVVLGWGVCAAAPRISMGTVRGRWS